MDNDVIFKRLAQALLCDYSSVYYVNAVTNEYVAFTFSPEFRSLKIDFEGKDFFRNLITDSEKVVYEEDKHIFQNDIQKENLMKLMQEYTMKDIVYRLMINGKPVYHQLRLIRGLCSGGDYFVLGVTNIDNKIRQELEAEKADKERTIYNQIAQSLASYYDTIYYVDSETDEYMEFTASSEYDELEIPKSGSSFFEESRKNITRFAHPEDQARIIDAMNKESMTEILKEKKFFSYTYRLHLGGYYKYSRLTGMWANDKKHFIIGVENIDAQMKKDLERKELERKSKTYSQILNSLAYRYDSIYYIDIKSGAYTQYSNLGSNGTLKAENTGTDFFADAPGDIQKVVFEQDCKGVIEATKKENILKRLDTADAYSITYRQKINDSFMYVSLRIAWAEDRRHIILGLANIDDQVRRENEYRRELLTATEKAMNDDLTGVKNMNAYQETELTMQKTLDSGDKIPFAVLICDLNGLKQINDTLGHRAGDEYIKEACRLICGIFSHSPVFRIGGDEFVVILKGHDYSERDTLFSTLRNRVLENSRTEEAPVIASGMAVYDASRHRRVSQVFELADSRMYENKKELKHHSKTM